MAARNTTLDSHRARNYDGKSKERRLAKKRENTRLAKLTKDSPMINKYTRLLLQTKRDRDIRRLTDLMIKSFGGIPKLNKAWMDHIREYPQYAGRSFAAIHRLQQHQAKTQPTLDNLTDADLIRQVEKISKSGETG